MEEMEYKRARWEETKKQLAEWGYPDLCGSEDLVHAANEKRLGALDLLYSYDALKVSVYLKKIPYDVVRAAIDYVYHKHVDCEFWLNIKTDNESTCIFDFFLEYLEHKAEETPKEEFVNCFLIPENVVKPGMVEIGYADGFVTAFYIIDDIFIQIMKARRFIWDGKVWKRECTDPTVTPAERAAELGNAIAFNGFLVRFSSAELKNRAIFGAHPQERDRCINLQENSNRLTITWDGFNAALYDLAKMLPKARWKDRSINVHIKYYNEVEDFAVTCGFPFTNTAKEAIQEYKLKLAKKGKGQNWNEDSRSDVECDRKSLKYSGLIIEDLLDDVWS